MKPSVARKLNEKIRALESELEELRSNKRVKELERKVQVRQSGQGLQLPSDKLDHFHESSSLTPPIRRGARAKHSSGCGEAWLMAAKSQAVARASLFSHCACRVCCWAEMCCCCLWDAADMTDPGT
jgi:hypothetical protein